MTVKLVKVSMKESNRLYMNDRRIYATMVQTMQNKTRR